MKIVHNYQPSVTLTVTPPLPVLSDTAKEWAEAEFEYRWPAKTLEDYSAVRDKTPRTP